MSFEKIQDLEESAAHERSCILLYGFTTNELSQLQNIARMVGLKDQVILKPEQSANTIKNILDDEMISLEGHSLKEKALIFNHITSIKMNAFIEAVKKCRINRPLIAVVTETSINWTLQELLMNLVQERLALKHNQFNNHK